MTVSTHHKVTASHLRRDAYLYVRQSTLRPAVALLSRGACSCVRCGSMGR